MLGNLVVGDSANAASWSLQTNLQVGSVINGDRTYTVASLPAALVGAAWVRAANSSKTSTANPLVTFTISQAATVFVGVDTRSGRRPWMDSSWVDTGTALTTDESGTTRTFEVFRKGSMKKLQITVGELQEDRVAAVDKPDVATRKEGAAQVEVIEVMVDPKRMTPRNLANRSRGARCLREHVTHLDGRSVGHAEQRVQASKIRALSRPLPRC